MATAPTLRPAGWQCRAQQPPKRGHSVFGAAMHLGELREDSRLRCVPARAGPASSALAVVVLLSETIVQIAATVAPMSWLLADVPSTAGLDARFLADSHLAIKRTRVYPRAEPDYCFRASRAIAVNGDGARCWQVPDDRFQSQTGVMLSTESASHESSTLMGPPALKLSWGSADRGF